MDILVDTAIFSNIDELEKFTYIARNMGCRVVESSIVKTLTIDNFIHTYGLSRNNTFVYGSIKFARQLYKMHSLKGNLMRARMPSHPMSHPINSFHSFHMNFACPQDDLYSYTSLLRWKSFSKLQPYILNSDALYFFRKKIAEPDLSESTIIQWYELNQEHNKGDSMLSLSGIAYHMSNIQRLLDTPAFKLIHNSPESEIFMKPDLPYKIKDARVTTTTDFIYDLTDMLSLCTGVIVAAAKPITHEIRTVIYEGKIITASYYIIDGEIDYCAIDMDDPILNILSPMVALITEQQNINVPVVLDFCLSNGEWKILELNCLSTSGLYECDYAEVIWVMKEYLRNGV